MFYIKPDVMYHDTIAKILFKRFREIFIILTVFRGCDANNFDVSSRSYGDAVCHFHHKQGCVLAMRFPAQNTRFRSPQVSSHLRESP